MDNAHTALLPCPFCGAKAMTRAYRLHLPSDEMVEIMIKEPNQ